MAFTTSTQAQIALKNLTGKSQTSELKGPNNEAEAISLVVTSDNVWTDTINSDPAQAVIDGVAENVVADLVPDPTSTDGSGFVHAYFAVYPTGHPNEDERVINAIPPSFGVGYEAKPYDATSTLIPPGDERDWIYQYQSGIFFQQDSTASTAGTIGSPGATRPLTINLYVYIGGTVASFSGGSGFSGYSGISGT
jgi:hypothetical protein